MSLYYISWWCNDLLIASFFSWLGFNVNNNKKDWIWGCFQSIDLIIVNKHSNCSYFPSTDKHETKLKGVIYFQAIEEVYYDHLRSATKVQHMCLLMKRLNLTTVSTLNQSYLANWINMWRNRLKLLLKSVSFPPFLSLSLSFSLTPILS